MSNTTDTSEQASPAAAPQAEPVGDAAPQAFSFMQESSAGAFWREPAVRLLLAFVAALLGLLLAVQVLVQERDRLAAQFPQWRTGLRTLCDFLDCRVGLLRQIESVSIDSSSFNKVAGGVYRLSFTLRNNALVALAMPALELTLTDAQDQPIARRVFQPVELLADSATLPARAEFNDALMLSIQSPDGAGPPAGYRLVAFYP